LAAPAASAEPFRESAVGVDVVADDGTVIGEVTAVERNANGDIVAAELAGLEPADAPFASDDLLAEDEGDQGRAPVRARDDSARGGVSARTATR
jgi:hypothetical protein